MNLNNSNQLGSNIAMNLGVRVFLMSCLFFSNLALYIYDLHHLLVVIKLKMQDD